MKAPTGPDSLTICALTGECERALVGRMCLAATSSADGVLSLRFDGPARPCALVVACTPAMPRIHVAGRAQRHAGAETPFLAAARSRLVDATLESVSQLDRERLVRLTFRRSTETNHDAHTLVVELYGTRSNLVLLDAGGTVVEAARHVTAGQSRTRTVLPRQGWVPPHLPGGDYASPLQEAYMAEHRATADELFRRARDGQATPQVLLSDEGQPTGGWPFVPPASAGISHMPAASISAAIEAVCSTWEAAAAAIVQRSAAMHALDRAIVAAVGARAAALAGIEEGSRAEEFEQSGQLLLMSPPPRGYGATEVTVPDPFSGEPGERTIPYDPAATPQANAQAWFRRARKARSAQRSAREALTRIDARLATLTRLRGNLDDASSDIGSVLRDAGIRDYSPGTRSTAPGRAASPVALKNIRTVECDGYTIMVGMSATGNDTLTTRVARPQDIWMHVRGGTSAHVVIRCATADQVPPAGVMSAAALLCAQQSSQRNSSLVAVDYVRKRHVVKRRKSAPGSVTYSHEKTIHVRPRDTSA